MSAFTPAAVARLEPRIREIAECLAESLRDPESGTAGAEAGSGEGDQAVWDWAVANALATGLFTDPSSFTNSNTSASDQQNQLLEARVQERTRDLQASTEALRSSENRLRVITDKLERMPEMVDRLYKRFA